MHQKTISAMLRRRLKRPHGRLYPGRTAARHLKGMKFIVSVGDIATETLLAEGIRPAVAIFDFRRRRKGIGRKTMAALQGFRAAKTYRVKNPAGAVSRALYDACRKAFSGKRFPAKIVVDGEEDLAVIPAVVFAPDGAAAYYGQPGKGGVIIAVNARNRRKFREIYKSMK